MQNEFLTYICVHIYTYKHIWVFTRTHMHRNNGREVYSTSSNEFLTYICVYIYIYTYKHIWVFIHTHMHRHNGRKVHSKYDHRPHQFPPRNRPFLHRTPYLHAQCIFSQLPSRRVSSPPAPTLHPRAGITYLYSCT